MTTLARSEEIREESLWFGATDQPLFGRLTTPVVKTAKGAVLLSPPIGRESRPARRALRTLAIYLAVDGYVSLRYDHFGTGDSSGSMEDEELVTTWIEGVDKAVGLLRSLGISTVSAVGMRMGATIVGTAATVLDLQLASFAMWDPCESGHSYVRELVALGALGPDLHPTRPGEPTRMLEYAMSRDAEKRLDQFSLTQAETKPIAKRVLVVTRDDRAISNKFRSRWQSEHVEWTTTSEQKNLMELQLPVSVLPTTTISTVREWLTSPSSDPVSYKTPSPSPDAIVSQEMNDYAVREHVATLGFSQMFGIVSEPVGQSYGPTIVMVNGVNEDHLGPARLWVELSRRWAALGLRCVRFDLSELGESPWLPGQPERPVFDKTRHQDVVDAVRSIDPQEPSNSVLIGFCSGAQLALEVAAELMSRGVCVISPEVGAGALPNVDRMKLSGRESKRSLVRRAEELLNRHRRAGKLVRRISRLVLSSTYPPKIPSELGVGDSDVLLLLSPDDLSPLLRVPIFGAVLSRRLVSSRNRHIEVVSGMDHALLGTVGRERAVTILHQFVVAKYVSPVSAPTNSGDAAANS